MSTNESEREQRRPRGSESFLSFDERQLVKRLLAHPEDFPPEFRSWLEEHLAVNPPSFVPSTIPGLIQVSVSDVSSVSASQSTTATSYTDLTTVGPTVTAKRAGRYLLIYGFAGVTSTTAGGAYMAPSVNGDTPSDREAAVVTNLSLITTTKAWIRTLDRPSNEIKLKYRAGSGTATFSDRYIIAARIGNA